MPPVTDNIGIVTRGTNIVYVFDADSLSLIQTIDVGVDANDVVITPDCTRAVITSFNSSTFVELDLTTSPIQIVGTSTVLTSLLDVDITPDNMFAVSVDGTTPGPIYSYNLLSNNSTPNLNISAQAIAVSPNGSGMVLTVQSQLNAVQRFQINNLGIIVGPIQTVPSGGVQPVNLTFTPDGNYAFSANITSNQIGIFNTSGTIGLSGSQLLANPGPQTIVVSKDGTKVYILTSRTVEIFNFSTNPSPQLSFDSRFNHGLIINTILGIDQMALDCSGDKLIISGNNVVRAFTINGTSLGDIPGAIGGRGIDICNTCQEPEKPTRSIILGN